MKPRLPSEIALVIAVPIFIGVNLLTLKDGHNWGGDFAQYIRNALNILSGQSYSYGLFMEGFSSQAPVVPPLFPLLLTPIMWLKGLDLWYLKTPNVLYWLAWAFVSRSLLYRRFGKSIANLGMLFLLSSPWLFCFKQSILSDLPFLLFSTSSILYYEKYISAHNEHDGQLYFISVMFFMILSMLTRSAGIALFIAMIIHLSLFRHAYKQAIFITACLLLCLTISITLDAKGGSYWLKIIELPYRDALLAFLINTVRYAKETSIFFSPAWPPGGIAFVAFLLLAVSIRFVRLKNIDLPDIFVFLYMCMIILWPYDPDVRLVLPVIIFLLIYSLEGISHFSKIGLRHIRCTVLLLLIFAIGLASNIVQTAYYWTFNDDVFFRPETREMIAWVKRNIPISEHYAFRKPRPLALFTDRTGVFGPTYDLSVAVTEVKRQKGIKWIILFRGNEEKKSTFSSQLQSFPHVKLMWENAGYIILTTL